MTESKLKTPEGMHTITPHIVVNDAAAATDWYKQVLGAEERSRIEVPGQAKRGVRTRAIRERQLEPASARACQTFAK